MGTLDEDRRRKKQQYNQRSYQNRKIKQRKAAGDERRILWSGRLRDTLLGRIQRIVNESIATGKWRYKTVTEAFEDLVVRGLTTLKDDPFIEEMMPFVEWMQNIDRLHTLRRETMAGVNKAGEEIRELQGIGANDGAVHYYHVTLEAIDRMPETEWRVWAAREMADRFPELHKQVAKGVAIDPAPTPRSKKR